MRKALILTVVALLVGCCSTALAAFPGRDGRLAVQPLSGVGIELVSTNGKGANRTCDDRLLCGSPISAPFGITAASCPSASFCALVASTDVITSTNPTGGTGAWTDTPNLSPGSEFSDISCASATLCVSTTLDGHVISSTNPTGGTGAWSAAPVESDGLQSISCPTSTFCAATGFQGHVVTSTNPSGGAGAWTAADIPGTDSDIACGTPSLCVVTGGELLTSTNPTAGSAAWTDTEPSPPGKEAAVSCASSAFCAVVDGSNTLLVSASPATGFPSYTATTLDATPCQTSGGCDTQDLYVNDDAGTRAIDHAVSANDDGDGITNLNLSGDSTTVTWTHSGQSHSLVLH